MAAGVLTVGLLLSGGAALAAPGDPGTVPGALVEISANAPRGWYIDANGLPHLLPKGPNAKPGASGDYKAMWFKGDSLGEGATGPAGPKGDKGDKGEPGDSNVVLKRASLVVNASTGLPKTITLTGLPPKSASVPEAFGHNKTELPTSFGATLNVTANPVANGATERTFTVDGSGFDGAETFTFNVWVLAVP